jgi:hypothetical protein
MVEIGYVRLNGLYLAILVEMTITPLIFGMFIKQWNKEEFGALNNE